MGLFDRLGLVTREKMRQEIEAAIKAVRMEGQHLLATADQQKWDIPDPQLYRNQAELLRRSPPVSVAVYMKGQVVADAKFSVKAVDAEEETDIPNHPFERLLDNPNPLDSRKEMFVASSASYDVTGNLYWWLNKAGENVPPDELWYMDSNYIVPVPDGRLGLSHYNYIVNGVEMRLETWEVVHWRRYNPFNRFVGLSLIEALAVTVTGDIEARKWNTRLFGENNARLPGILAFKDPINDTDWDRIKADIKQASKEREQLLLRGAGTGVDWQQASATHREMEFLEGLGNSKQLVWDAIAPGLTSMLDPNATEASSKTGETVFRNYAVYPQQCMLAEKMVQKILPSYGDNLTGEFDDIRITDRVMELQIQQAYERTHTVDEIRNEHYGDDPIGDERGNLFVTQVTAAKAEPEPMDEDNPQNNPETENEQDMTEDEQEETAKADYLPDLRKWKEKAKKRGAGVTVDYKSDDIPQDVYKAILTRLPACKSKHDIDLLFDGYIAPLTKTQGGGELSQLAALLETAIKAMQNERK